MSKIDPNVLIKAGVGIIGILMLRKVLQSIGILQTSSDVQKEQNLQQLESANYWNYNEFLKNIPAGALLLTQSGATAYVNDLWNATGTFNDDEEMIYGVFRAMKTKSQVASLAKRFNQLKAKDLYGYLSDYLSDSELLKVKGIIDQKPTYKL